MIAIQAVALALALIVAGTLFSRRALLLYRLIRSGKPASRSGDLPARARAEAVVVVGQSKLLLRLVPGLVHAAIFWGFLVLFPTIVIAMIGAVDPHSTLPWLGTQGWYALLVDVFAVLVLGGVVAAFLIRKVQRPARFKGSPLGEADLILALIAGIVITLLLWHASPISMGLNDYPASWAPISSWLASMLPDSLVPYMQWVASWVWSPVSNLLGQLLGGPSLAGLERAAVWAHVLIILTFLVYLPYSKHLHIVVAAINVYFGRTRARGPLGPVRV